MTDNRTTETATSRIIATLRERNVQFATHGNTDRVWWATENGVTWYAQDRPNANELFVKLEAVLTPEQAIAATLGSGTLTANDVLNAVYKHGARWQAIADELNAELGSGTCENVWAESGKFKCSECAMEVIAISTNTTTPRPISFCPNCGREAVDEC